MAVAVSAVGLRATYCAEQKKQKKKRVAIYGGALDPITNDHLVTRLVFSSVES